MKKQANKVLALTCKPAFWLDAVRRTGRLPGKEEPPITVEGKCFSLHAGDCGTRLVNGKSENRNRVTEGES